ncbi:MAG TPA: PEGA domain-containing protein [Polyangia bacterium]|nr:PEGA domain-containing protein [Polyangia bacterium]
MKRVGMAVLAALILGGQPAAARAAEKLAVLVLGTVERDAELADNLTEVIIARVAQRGGNEIAGKEEFRARLGVENESKAQACLDDIACLGRAAVSLGVRHIVAGSVGTRGKQFLFNLNLDNVESGRVENRVFRLVEGGVEDLIRAVQEGTDELFRAKVEPGRIQVSSLPDGARVSIDNAYLGVTPLISGTLLAGKHNVRVEADQRFPWTSKVEVLPGQDLQIKLTQENLPRRRQWPATAAYGTLVGAAVSFAAGAFLGVLSQLQPNGDTRYAAQQDFDQKRRFALFANISFGAGALFTILSSTFFIRYRDDIFGRAERLDENP